MRWPIALVCACACGRVGFDPLVTSDAPTDTAGSDAVSVCATWSTWSAPAIIPVVSSSATDWAPSISDDDLRLTFSSNRTGNQELYLSTRTSTTDAWGTPSQIGELANASDEQDDPTTSSSELEMIFGKTQLLRTTRPNVTSPWGQRTVIVPNDFAFVQGAELTHDDLRLYFNAGPSETHLYLMERPTPASAFGAYAMITPDPDPGGDTGFPTLSADELELFVSSNHGTGRDIYTAHRSTRTDAFPQFIVAGDLSSGGSDEIDPELSLDGTTMYQSIDSGAGFDLRVSTRTCQD